MPKQINLRLPDNLVEAAMSYARHHGYRNVQELATQSLREKVMGESTYDETFSDKEIELFEALAELSIKTGQLHSKEEILAALRE